MFQKTILLFFISFLLLQNKLESQTAEAWKTKAQDSFLQLLRTQNQKKLNNIRIQLWTVTPGVSVTTAFGHSALRIFEGKEYGDSDYYLDFGVYDPSPGFLWRFMKGEANFFVNIIPTGSAYQTWDESGRGIRVSELVLTETQKHTMLNEILSIYEANQNGYYYDNFTNNCVTFLRQILSKTHGKPIELITMDAEKNTWRKRVQPYSTSIVWLNVNETLLFDKDTDIVRNPNEIIYLPEDLRQAVVDAGLSAESTVLLKDRWGDKSGKSGALWRILFAIILIFSLPFPLMKIFERYSEITFAFVSGIGGTIATLVYFFTSFSFMNETISWLVYSPLDFLLLKPYKSWKNKRNYWIFVGVRVFMILLAFILRISIYPQDVDAILFLSSVFFGLLIFKKRTELHSIFKPS